MHQARCIDCLTAKTQDWRTFTRDCPGCMLRMIAYKDDEGREREYDAFERLLDRNARAELARCVNEERARIRALEGVKA